MADRIGDMAALRALLLDEIEGLRAALQPFAAAATQRSPDPHPEATLLCAYSHLCAREVDDRRRKAGK